MFWDPRAGAVIKWMSLLHIVFIRGSLENGRSNM